MSNDPLDPYRIILLRTLHVYINSDIVGVRKVKDDFFEMYLKTTPRKPLVTRSSCRIYYKIVSKLR